MSERASFLCDTVGNTVTVYIRGEIDHHSAVHVRNGIDGMLFEKRPLKMILDLSAVGFMDSSGLGLIMGRLSVMKSLGGEMTVRNPSHETESILTLAGMERLIHIEYTEDRPLPRKAQEQAKKKYVPPEATPSRNAGSSKKIPASDGKGSGQGGGSNGNGTRRRMKAPTTSA